MKRLFACLALSAYAVCARAMETKIAVAFFNYGTKNLYYQLNNKPERIEIAAPNVLCSNYSYGVSNPGYIGSLALVKPSDSIEIFENQKIKVSIRKLSNFAEDTIVKINANAQITTTIARNCTQDEQKFLARMKDHY